MGNRLSEVETTAAGTDTTTYSYDDNDRLLTETVTGLNPATVSYSYDNNGNTLTRIDGSGTTSYAYDSRNRLSDLNAGQTTYLYDASGIRMSETSSGLTTNYLVDPNRDYAQVVEESFDLNSFAEVRYTYGDDLLAQHRRVDALTTNSSTYHYDGIGSTRRLTDTNSLVTDSYAFTAFGELAGSTGVTVNDYLYTGEQFDPNLGFYYLRARYYNAGIGRFQNMDTFAGRMFEPITLHKYLYANGGPINFVDPSGQFGIAEASVANAVSSILNSFKIDGSFNLFDGGLGSFGATDAQLTTRQVHKLIAIASLTTAGVAITRLVAKKFFALSKAKKFDRFRRGLFGNLPAVRPRDGTLTARPSGGVSILSHNNIDSLVKNETYLYVVDESDNLLLAIRGSAARGTKHPQLVGGGAAKAAGELQVVNGRVLLNNESGNFIRQSNQALASVRALLQSLGKTVELVGPL